MSTKKVNQTKVTAIVNAYYNEGVTLDDTALALTQEGIAFTAIQDTIKAVGVKNEWVLTPEKVKAKVEKALEGKVLAHYLDVVHLAKSIDMPQLSIEERKQAIAEYGKLSKSVYKEPSKFKKLHGSGHHGKIAEWIKANPEFTADDLHKSGVCTAPNASEYYDEFLAYQEFFKA